MANNGDVPAPLVDEEIVALRQSCNGYVGNLARRYNELERLMLSIDNCSEVERKYAQLEETYELYVEKFQALKERLGEGPVAEIAISEFEARNQNRMEFSQRVTEYKQGAKSKEVLPGESQVNIPLDNTATKFPGSSASSVGSRKSSTSSAKLREAKLKQELARLKLKQLERKQALEKERTEFTHRMELLDAQNERERADLEVSMWQEENTEHPSVKEEIIRPNWTSADKTGQVPSNLYTSMYDMGLGACNDANVKTGGGGNVRNDVRPSFNPVPPVRNNASEPLPQNTKEENKVKGGEVADADMTRLFQTISLSMSIPKPELMSFDGDPAAYWGFVNSFDTNIAKKVLDDRSKLTYLIQFCKGKAKQSIENCVLMNAAEGYKKARDILYDQFGQPHDVTHALIGKIVNREPIKPNDGQALWDLARQMRTCEITLNQLGYVANMNSTDTLLKIQQLLPVYLQTEWAKKAYALTKTHVEPNFTHMTEYLEQAAHVASNMYGQNIRKNSRSSDKAVKSKTKSNVNPPSRVTTLTTQSGNASNFGGENCILCRKAHRLTACEEFRAYSLDERCKVVRTNKLCYNCLVPMHFANGCMVESKCKISGCKGKHDTLLHFPGKSPGSAGKKVTRNGGDVKNSVSKHRSSSSESEDKSKDKGNSEKGQIPDSAGTACHANVASCRKVCMRVVPVKVQANCKEVQTWALLDEGSDVTLCDKGLIDLLGVKGISRKFHLTTINRESSEEFGLEVDLTVSDVKGNESVYLPKVWTVDKLPISEGSIPNVRDISKWPHLQGINFPMIEGKEIMLLIGVDVPEVFWVLEERRGKRKEPYAVRSLLGWTLIGPLRASEGQSRFHTHYVKYEDTLLERQVEKFWENDLGDLMIDIQERESIEDRRARSIMEKSLVKVDGHYQMGLPWRHGEPVFPNNRPYVEARLRWLKKRFQRDTDLYTKYKETIDDHLEKGYAKAVPCDNQGALRGSDHQSRDTGQCEDQAKVWYLPHHPVFHPQKPGKVRVVFDCAARYKGTSLNDQLLRGPDFTNNLVGVLSRFRKEPIAMTADIEAMFHQVRVNESDCGALRFLWWRDGDYSTSPIEFQMLVHIFGATSSPSCAGFALRRAALDNSGDYDTETVKTVLNNFYVDDCLKSVKTEQEAIRLVSQLREMLKKGGFRLTKWVCNNHNVLATVPEEERATSVKDLGLDILPLERTLGVRWDVESDKFVFRVSVKDKPHTRRGVLSLVSSLFDPLGFLAPFTLKGKLLLQDVCRQGLGWDELIPGATSDLWKEWLSDLPRLSDITIDRCFTPKGYGSIVVNELHTFADASERGYAAVSYLRMVDENGFIHCAFVMGKSRLCPLKAVTIPRLELTAAVLAVRLSQMIQRELKFEFSRIMYWTDSTIVLQYIQNESKRFRTYVANRVAMIREATDTRQWHHVRSELNPADQGSRGVRAIELLEIKHWLKGPDFLWQPEETWPTPPVVLGNDPKLEADPEVKGTARVCLVEAKGPLDELLLRYSSWSKLLKGVAWILRFRRYLYHRAKGVIESNNFKKGGLNVEDIREAEREVVKYVQGQCFQPIIDSLESQTKGTHKGCMFKSVRKLNPILIDGVLRVGGRLQNAPLDDDVRHPIILPSKHHVTDLVIGHHHVLVGHLGAGSTWSSLRERFWVIRGGVSVRRVVGKCFQCKRRNAPTCQQLMAELPSVRVTPDKPPFTNVGIDYFGPLYVKQGRSHVKRYGCLFTCLTVRAVHIEIAHSLDTDSFINALRRFVSRRGLPESIYSDNGTNFTSSERELRKRLQEVKQSDVKDFLLQKGVSWHFNPPSASHMGGVWERIIRSVRKILKSLLGEQIVNDEVLLTVMAEVESILNSRPLTQLSLDPGDNEPLTPNHLLLMKSNQNLPPGIFSKSDGYGKRRWRQTQYLADQFWKRWVKEYLPLLQQRQKWVKPKRSLEVNDLVLVVDENSPRGRWPLGRVLTVYPGKDGRVRQVDVRVGSKCFRRPIVKLCFLERG